jgi:hypothetical protein
VFDNNCKLDQHQQAIGDDHFKFKHKATDTHCQRFCNPAAFLELIKNGKWTVDMSICEQSNVWFGGHLAIVQDMEVVHYNFFLDEMIKQRIH